MFFIEYLNLVCSIVDNSYGRKVLDCMCSQKRMIIIIIRQPTLLNTHKCRAKS